MDAFRSIGRSLGDIAASGPMGAPPPAQGDGGKFSFAPAEIEVIIEDWLKLADGYTQSMRSARSIMTVTPPGNEFASEMHASTTSASGESYLSSIEQKLDYCYSQAQKFQDALSDYQGVDRKNVRRIDAAGESTGSGGI